MSLYRLDVSRHALCAAHRSSRESAAHIDRRPSVCLDSTAVSLDSTKLLAQWRLVAAELIDFSEAVCDNISIEAANALPA